MTLWKRPWSVDALVVAGVALFAVSGTVHPHAVLPGWVMWPGAAGQALPLPARRRRPLAVVAATAVAGFCSAAAGVPTGACLPGLLAACYAAAAFGRPPRTVLAPTLGLLAAPGYLLFARSGGGDRLVSATAVTLAVALAWVLGYAQRTRRSYVAGLIERAERLEREADARAAQAIAEERLRIARELHDALGHAVSVIAIQSDAALRTLATDPEAAAGYLRVIGRTSRAAMTELRQMLRVLRPEEGTAAEWDTAPGLAGLADLVARIEAAGVPVRLETEGEPASVPMGPGTAGYRIVQEALTNVVRHAGAGAHARVAVCCEPRLLRLRITDDGAGVSTVADGTALGILGMRERVAVYGGTLHTGPVDGGFEIRAEIPLPDQDFEGRD
ncbi:sensor histidine kinase [Kitasatospora mediocidica]|uniref:sensor histidine kinase n=1 Tax=Kitasatospora mediocidica TaxID=58352 RepID=UPI00055F0E39|nr:sensor histidine kinase [Kitasatospora mediocidica]